MPLATPADAMREFAWNVGAESPDTMWLLTDYDVWVRNPHYSGPPQPHPEEWEPGDDLPREPSDHDMLGLPWRPTFEGEEPPF